MSFLVLFIIYQTSVTAFAHVHYINGVSIIHSHPFNGSHSHSKASLAVVGQLSTFFYPEVNGYENHHPMRALLAVLEAEPTTPTAKGEIVRVLSLRAPPVFPFFIG